MRTDQGLRRFQLSRMEQVNLNGSWYQIDLTYAVTRNVRNAKTLHDCVSPLTYTNTSDTLAAEAA